MKSKDEQLFEQLEKLQTEQRNPATHEIDLADSLSIVRLMNEQDHLVSKAIGKHEAVISRAIDIVAASLAVDGRLFYMGAGTSGRLGVLDAAECPPTFGSDPEQIQGLIAGGKEAMFVAQEGAEDNPENGKKDLEEKSVGKLDVVCGLAASGRTPYMHGGLEYAQSVGAKTILICCVPESQLKLPIQPDVIIAVDVGPEVIMGSTRLKSGTAQKMICNMITTGAFIRMGKVYENVMVDLQLTNAKLVERARRIVMMFTKLRYQDASDLLKSSGNNVKTAIFSGLTNKSNADAQKILKDHNGFLRSALENHS